MSKVKANPAPSGRVDVAGCEAAHLTREAVTVQHFGAEFRGDAASEFHPFRRHFREKILAGFQVRAVVVGKDLPSLFVAKLTYPFAFV